jgi:anti-sigma factor RsiW
MMARMLSPRFMRDHMWTRKHLSGYLDEELEPSKRKRVEHHVHMCPSCHRLLATLRDTLEGLRALGRRPLPAEGVADSVIARLRDSSADPP